ncbi:hypothetical protein D9M72_529780 [compost metagenome]
MEGPAFHQREAVLHHVALAPEREEVLPAHSRAQTIFATVQGLSGEIEAPVQAQPERTVQHLFILQARQQVSGGIAGGNLQQSLFGEFQWLL